MNAESSQESVNHNSKETTLTTADMSKIWTEIGKANATGFQQFDITTTCDNISGFSNLGTTHTTFEMKKQSSCAHMHNVYCPWAICSLTSRLTAKIL